MTDLDLGWIGVWLLVLGVLAIVLQGVFAAVWTARIVKRSRALREAMTSEQAKLQAESARLQAALADMEVLWQPSGRLLGWLRHPIAIALLQSFARRRAAAR
jgi:hypothetical protein